MLGPCNSRGCGCALCQVGVGGFTEQNNDVVIYVFECELLAPCKRMDERKAGVVVREQL